MDDERNLEHYLGLRYPITLQAEAEGGFVAEVADLPGCLSQGETVAEAVANVEEARRLWLETAWEHGDEIPLPAAEADYSGRLLVRMPRTLHRKLAEGARREGVSLNQHILALLSERSVAVDLRRLEAKLDHLSTARKVEGATAPLRRRVG